MVAVAVAVVTAIVCGSGLLAFRWHLSAADKVASWQVNEALNGLRDRIEKLDERVGHVELKGGLKG